VSSRTLSTIRKRSEKSYSTRSRIFTSGSAALWRRVPLRKVRTSSLDAIREYGVWYYQNAHEDEGNAYLRLGEALQEIGRIDEARAAYQKGIDQAEKFGHSGMAEDLRLAPIELGER
jgi:hypothetical protein